MKQSQGYVEFNDYAALAAENERLRKAGDAMADAWIKERYRQTSVAETMTIKNAAWGFPLIEAWLAAKKGRDAK